MYSQMCLFLLNSLYVFDHSSEGGSSPAFLRDQPCRPTPPPPLKKMGGVCVWGGGGGPNYVILYVKWFVFFK